jgi:predicted amidohydrolase
MRLALLQMRVYPGDPARNARWMLQAIEAHRGRVDLVVFPEMSVPGY